MTPGGAAGADDLRRSIDEIYRRESRRILATLIRLLGDFDVAEEALHDAFVLALERWMMEGVPAQPRPWLVSAGRFRAIDKLRRRAQFDAHCSSVLRELSGATVDAPEVVESVADDRLRLIFTCCHPALSPEAQVALTLRTVCGLTTEEIAHAYLVPVPTMAQRIVRAKNKIRDARIPYAVPERNELEERLDAVLQTIYLVFNEGYSASAGAQLIRADLSAEAIRLCRLVLELLDAPEVRGLLALMLLHDARRAARTNANGDLVLLEDQDRALWDRAQIAEGIALTQTALGGGKTGPFGLQAAIAAVHAEAQHATQTDWPQIVGLYDALTLRVPGPVVELNRAVAVAMAYGAERGLALLQGILGRGDLREYVHAHAAQAELLRRLGRRAEARAAYERALQLATQGPERRFLGQRLLEVSDAAE